MKTSKAFKFFLIAAVCSAAISILMYFYNREANLDFSVFDITIHSSYAMVWEMFCLYAFVLAVIYLIIDSSSLKSRGWLVASHVVFILLFLLVFAGFSIFDISGFRFFISAYRIPALSIFAIYAFLLLIDIALFFGGLFLLVLNLFSLRKEKHS